MARGWESKGVDDQIAELEAKREANLRPQLSAAEREARVRYEGLVLSRRRLVAAIESARDDRYREQLSRALADIDREIAENTESHWRGAT